MVRPAWHAHLRLRERSPSLWRHAHHGDVRGTLRAVVHHQALGPDQGGRLYHAQGNICLSAFVSLTSTRPVLLVTALTVTVCAARPARQVHPRFHERSASAVACHRDGADLAQAEMAMPVAELPVSPHCSGLCHPMSWGQLTCVLDAAIPSLAMPLILAVAALVLLGRQLQHRLLCRGACCDLHALSSTRAQRH
jgi:hypothetical protein